jgi:pyruvate formate lyase activating enzyme
MCHRQHLPKRMDNRLGDAPEAICPVSLSKDQIPGNVITPDEIVRAVLRVRSTSIAYTCTEPTIFCELAYDTATLARSKGLKNVFVSNGFINEAPFRQFALVLDAVSIELQFFKAKSYRRVSRARLGPVLETIRLYHDLGVWVEVTILIIPGLNDSAEEPSRIAEFVCSVGPGITWHVSRFHPSYKLTDVPPTPVKSLRFASEIGRRASLRYVYEGNVPGKGAKVRIALIAER